MTTTNVAQTVAAVVDELGGTVTETEQGYGSYHAVAEVPALDGTVVRLSFTHWDHTASKVTCRLVSPEKDSVDLSASASITREPTALAADFRRRVVKAAPQVIADGRAVREEREARTAYTIRTGDELAEATGPGWTLTRPYSSEVHGTAPAKTGQQFDQVTFKFVLKCAGTDYERVSLQVDYLTVEQATQLAAALATI